MAASQRDNVANQIKGITAKGNVTAGTMNVNVASSAQLSQENYGNSFWTVDDPVVFFQGRKELLETIHEKLQERLPKQHFMQRIVALVGMGGMGKTEIARKLAHEYHEHYENVAWIDARTEESLSESFHKIAKILKLPDASSETKAKDLADLVYGHIGQHVKSTTLFIFDHANQLKTDGGVFGIFDYLPGQKTKGRPLILLTSQLTEWRKDSFEVIRVPELTQEDSLACLRSELGLSRKPASEDSELRDLVENLNRKLNGYPLALGLAVANIDFIPGEDSKMSLELLKQGLKKYMQCIDEDRFLEHRLDAQIGAPYPHTVSQMWNDTMANLQRQKYEREAKFLLGILAYSSQQDLKAHLVRKMYGIRSSKFGLKYPSVNDASFEEALHALQAVDLVKYDENEKEVQFQSEIKVRTIVQKLSTLGDEPKTCLQKILLYNLKSHWYFSRTWRHFVLVNEEALWSDDGIPSWSMTSSPKLMLWLHGLRYLRCSQGGEQAMKNWLNCKPQLQGLEHGEDFVHVGDFMLNSRSFEQCDNDYVGERFICPWTVLENAVQVKSSLSVGAPKIRIFLELLLLSVVGDSFASTLRNLESWNGSEEFLMQLRNWPSSSSVLNGITEWLSDFDFSTLFNYWFALGQIEHTIRVLVQVSRIISLKGDTVELVTPKTIFRLADAEMAIFNQKSMACGRLANLLYHFVGRPEQAEELIHGYKLLDYLALALKGSGARNVAAALGIIRRLVLDPRYVHHVIQHENLMASLESASFWKHLEPILTRRKIFFRFRSNEEIKQRFPGVVHAAIVPRIDGTEKLAVAYGFLLIKFAINAVITKSASHSGALLKSARKLVTADGCKVALSSFTAFDGTGGELETIEWDWYTFYSAIWVAFLTKSDLEQDKTILRCALEIFKRKGGNEFLLPCLEKVQQMNEMFLSAVSKP